MDLQLKSLFREAARLQQIYGDPSLSPILGAGEINKPQFVFIFMNPTARNIASNPDWKGIKAPWLGTKNIWKLLYQLGCVNKGLFQEIQKKKVIEWDEAFASEVYKALKVRQIYITNLAKCTQVDARPLRDLIYKKYLDLMQKEIFLLQPKHIITFGNQVSSVFLEKKVQVSQYLDNTYEVKKIHGKEFKVYPAFYPVGQGMRNMDKAVERIKTIINF